MRYCSRLYMKSSNNWIIKITVFLVFGGYGTSPSGRGAN